MKIIKYKQEILLFLFLILIVLKKLNIPGSIIALLCIGIIINLSFLFQSSKILHAPPVFKKQWLIVVFSLVLSFASISILFNVLNYAGNDILSLISLLALLFIIIYSAIMIKKQPEFRKTYRNIIIYGIIFHATLVFTAPL